MVSEREAQLERQNELLKAEVASLQLVVMNQSDEILVLQEQLCELTSIVEKAKTTEDDDLNTEPVEKKARLNDGPSTSNSKTVCDKCNNDFGDLSSLARHYPVCKRKVEKPFVCDECNYRGPSAGALKCHKSRYHGTAQKCGGCSHRFVDLDSHMKNCSSLKNKICEEHCGQIFSHIEGYNRHCKDFKYEIDNIAAGCEFSRALDEIIKDESKAAEASIQFARLRVEFKKDLQRHSDVYFFIDPQSLNSKSSFKQFAKSCFRVGSTGRLHWRKIQHKSGSKNEKHEGVNGSQEYHDKLNEIWSRKSAENKVLVFNFGGLSSNEVAVIEGAVIESICTKNLTNKLRGTPTIKFGVKDRHPFAQAGSHIVFRFYEAFKRGQYDKWSREKARKMSVVEE